MGPAAGEEHLPAQPLVLHLSVTTCAVLQRLQLQGTAVRPVPDQGHWVLDFGELLLSMHSRALEWHSPAQIACVLFRRTRPTTSMLPLCWVQSCLWACLGQPGSGVPLSFKRLQRSTSCV